MATLADYERALHFLPGQAVGTQKHRLNFGIEPTSGISWLKVTSANGTIRYLFVDNNGNLRSSTTEPTSNTAGTALTTLTDYDIVAKDTNGTTPVNVIAATVPFACTITGVYLISKDTTAGNITVADTAGTVATIAKGTTSGAMVGAVSLANTSVAAGDTLTIVSSSAGNATVFITFTVV